MKRFLVFVIICIVTLSLGLTTYYFLRDNETIIVTDSYFEINKGDTFVVNVEHTNKNPKTVINFESLQPNIVEYNPVLNIFRAQSGGRAIVQVTSNKMDFKPVTIEVVVGDGTANSPFFIDSIESFLMIGKEEVFDIANNSLPNYLTMDSSYKLTNDLDFSTLTSLDATLMANNGISSTIYENGIWLPFGYDALEGEAFNGTFDFNGHIISNMRIEEDEFENGITVNNAGLFSKLEANAKVLNLTMVNPTISGSFITAGSIVGLNNGTVERSSVLGGSIVNTSLIGYTGGVVGQQEVVLVVDSIIPYTEMVYSNAEVNTAFVGGGLVGYNYGGIIVSSYSDATIIGEVSSILGGIVGLNEYKQINSVNYKANVKDTYYYGLITSGTTQKGGILGENINQDELTNINIIRGNYYSSEITGEIEAIGGLLNSEIDDERIGVYNKTLSQLQIQSTYYSYKDKQDISVYWSFTKTWQLNEDVNNGLPILNMAAPKINHNFKNIDDGVSISTLQDLYNITNDMSGVYVLTNDLEINLSDWIPIGYNSTTGNVPFNGVFVANIDPLTEKPYIISGLNITTTRSVAGLFAEIGSQGQVRDLILSNVSIIGGYTSGAVAAINNGLIDNVSVISTSDEYFITANNTTGTTNVGAIVGINSLTGTISNVTSNIDIKVNSSNGRHGNGGGLVGLNEGNINNSSSSSSISSTGVYSKYIGGIAGNNVKNIEYVFYIGDITVPHTADKVFVGGITGYLSVGASIKYSYTASGNYQGFAVGGLVGISKGTVEESYTDIVNIKAKYAGGLAFNISEGIFRNVYTLAFMSGVDNSSIKAGFAYFIDYHSSSVYGKVENAFSGATYDSIGENYAETSAPVRTELGVLVQRQAGYIVNSIYSTEQTLKEQNFISAFNSEFLIPEEDRKVVVSTEHATGTDSKEFSTFIAHNFSDTIWLFEVGKWPQLRNALIFEIE